MKYENEVVDAVVAELDRFHIKWHKERTDGNHLRLTWRPTPDKEEREMILPFSHSDWRARQNARAHIRRLLRHDGVLTEPKPALKPQPSFAKILNLPKPIEPIPDQLTALRAEIEDLTRMTQEIHDYVMSIKTSVTPKPVVAPPSVRSVNLLEHMTHNPTLVELLANRTNLARKVVYCKLQYLKKKGEVINVRGMWRRTTPEEKARAGTA